MNKRSAAPGVAFILCALLAAVTPYASAGAESDAKADEQLPDIGQGLFEIDDQPLPYVETSGTKAPRMSAQTKSYRSAIKRQGIEPLKWTGASVEELAGALQESDPTSYTTLAHAPEGQAYDYDLVFTTKPSPSLIEEVQSLPPRVRVRWGAPLGVNGLETAQRAVFAELQQMFPGHTPYSEIAFSPMQTVLGVFVGGDLPDPLPMTAADVSARLATAVKVATGVDTLPVIAEFDQTLEPAVEREVLHGGRAITNCTTGFGAFRPSTGTAAS